MSRAPAADEHGAPAPEQKSRFHRFVQKVWWLHSFGALGFGIFVMLFASKGLAHADKVLMVAGVSWLLLFVALRFIVGPANRSEGEHFTKKGFRVVTNYVIKQMYQQMFFFLVPLYASAATWSLSSYNWWLPPLLLTFAVVSTLDLVFDNFIMERRVLASCMYGVALFGALNVLVPMVFGFSHFVGLMVAAGATPPAVALLSFRVKQVLSFYGVLITLGATAGMLGGAYFGRAAIPPAPMSLSDSSVGHGTPGSYECLQGPKRRADQLDGLRCGSLITEPGGLRDEISHVWKGGGKSIRVEPHNLDGCDDNIFVSTYPADELPDDPTGGWQCVIQTVDRQLLGIVHFKVDEAEVGDEAVKGDAPTVPADAGASSGTGTGKPVDAGASSDTGTGTGTGTGVAADAATASDAQGGE
jgi:hypothetical protein